MWNVDELFILSDIHLAAERGVGSFQADAELVDCLRWILTKTRDSVTVLAGDVLDFLVFNNEDTKTGFSSLGDRTRGIIDYHPEVFETLAELALSPRHQLVVMGGDHDPGLILPTVQETVERHLGIDFINPAIRWLVQGEALRLRVGNAVVLIEHGNVLDPCNRIDHAGLQSACSLASRNLLNGSDYHLPPPLGSTLVLKVVNELRSSYRWIDCLKPETEAVLPLLWHFASSPQQTLIFNFVDEYFDMKDKAFNRKIVNSRRPERLYTGEKETAPSPKDQALKEWGAGARAQQSPTAGNKEADKLIEKLKSVSAQDAFFEINKPDDSISYLKPRFEAGADLVIHGHTHSAKAYAVEGGFYLNTGTWCQLLHLPRSDESNEAWQSFLDLLRTNDVRSSCRPTFARVQHREKRNVTTATLLEWQQPGPKILAARRFANRQTGWRKEA